MFAGEIVDLSRYPTSVKPEGVLNFWSIYKLTVGVLAAAESLLGMLRSVNSPETTVWGALTVAASVLLAIDGLIELFPKVNRWIGVALAAIVPIAISVLSGDWPAKLWVFAVAVGFVEWVFLELKRVTGRTEIGVLACCMVLGSSLANTTLMLFRMYWNEPEFWPLGQIFRFMLPITLPWTLILILLWHSAREVAAHGSDTPKDAPLAVKAGDD